MNILISAILMMAAFWVGVCYDEDKEWAILTQQPIKTWKLWTAVALFAASFLTYWLGSK